MAKKPAKKLSAAEESRNRAVTLGALLAGIMPRDQAPINPYAVAIMVGELQAAARDVKRRARIEREYPPALSNRIRVVNQLALEKREAKINASLRFLFLNTRSIPAPEVILTGDRASEVGAHLRIPEIRSENWIQNGGIWDY